MKKVLCIAECCCDVIFGDLDRIPALGQEEYSRYFAVKAGGGANTAMGLARLGVPTRFLTRLGNDLMGRLVLDCLVESGLDIESFTPEEGVQTPVSAVMSTKKDRCFVSFMGSGGAFITTDRLEKEIAACDHVHTYIGYCLAYPIVRLCQKYGKTLSLDTSWTEHEKPGKLEPVLSYASLFTPNDKEAMQITGAKTPQAALEILADICPGTVVTIGEKGSIAMISGKIHHQDCISYGPVLDSTGAGDMFCAGLIYGYCRGLALEKCMEIASHTSGLCVTYYGGYDKLFSPANLRFENSNF